MPGVDVLSRIMRGVLSTGELGAARGAPVGERGSRTMALAALVAFLTEGKGGAQGLRALVDNLHRAGLTRQVNSWIDRGPNATIQADDLRRAFSDKALNTISRDSGIREGELLLDLARGLPAFVEKLCPRGRLPRSDAEIPEMPEDDLLDELGRGAAGKDKSGPG